MRSNYNLKFTYHYEIGTSYTNYILAFQQLKFVTSIERILLSTDRFKKNCRFIICAIESLL